MWDHLLVQGESKGAPQRQNLAALVRKIVNELAVLAVLPHQRLPQLEHRRVDGHCAVALEHARDAATNVDNETLDGITGKSFCKGGS